MTRTWEDERRDVVAYLRAEGHMLSADAIERGAHVTERPAEPLGAPVPRMRLFRAGGYDPKGPQLCEFHFAEALKLNPHVEYEWVHLDVRKHHSCDATDCKAWATVKMWEPGKDPRP